MTKLLLCSFSEQKQKKILRTSHPRIDTNILAFKPYHFPLIKKFRMKANSVKNQ